MSNSLLIQVTFICLCVIASSALHEDQMAAFPRDIKKREKRDVHEDIAKLFNHLINEKDRITDLDIKIPENIRNFFEDALGKTVDKSFNFGNFLDSVSDAGEVVLDKLVKVFEEVAKGACKLFPALPGCDQKGDRDVAKPEAVLAWLRGVEKEAETGAATTVLPRLGLQITGFLMFAIFMNLWL